MRIVEWEDKYCLGIEPIDSHHKYLIRLLNRSYKALSSSEQTEEFSFVFKELLEYSNYHFSTEEEMMRRYDYTKSAFHIADHELFKQRLDELHAGVGAEAITLDVEVIFLLEEWLLNHILIHDKDLGAFIKKMGCV